MLVGQFYAKRFSPWADFNTIAPWERKVALAFFLKIFSSCLSCPSWKKTHGSLRAFRVLRARRHMVLFVPFVSFVDKRYAPSST